MALGDLEILFILFVMLLVLGPRRIGNLGRAFQHGGRGHHDAWAEEK